MYGIEPELSGSGTVTWAFDPGTIGVPQSTFNAALNIAIDGQAIAQPLALRGTAARPTMIGVNRSLMEQELRAYLKGPLTFDNMGEDTPSESFINTFLDALFEGDGSPEQEAKRNQNHLVDCE